MANLGRAVPWPMNVKGSIFFLWLMKSEREIPF